MFVDAWVDLWRRVTCLPNFSSDMANRIFVDVMNEPGEAWSHGGAAGLSWLGTAHCLQGWSRPHWQWVWRRVVAA
jgi:hypothetical protein